MPTHSSSAGPKAKSKRAAASAASKKAPSAKKAAGAASAEPAAAPLSPETIAEIYRRFHAAEPEPKGELDHTNAFTLLVAVALSAQATDKGVNAATRALFKIADTPERMIALGEEGLIEHIKTIGLFRNKAKNVMALCRLLLDKHGGVVPTSRAALEALPGVGRKTANVVLNMWFKQPTMAVDTHVFRVGNRTGLAPGKDVVAVERRLEDVTPVEYNLHAHHWLILHGRYLCKARKPECGRCLIADLCGFPLKTAQTPPDAA
ncbi:MAG: endonuclease III [Pseudomonadota bacterium]